MLFFSVCCLMGGDGNRDLENEFHHLMGCEYSQSCRILLCVRMPSPVQLGIE